MALTMKPGLARGALHISAHGIMQLTTAACIVHLDVVGWQSLILKLSFYLYVSEITRSFLLFCLGPHLGCLSPPKASTSRHPTNVPYWTGPWCFVQTSWVKKKKRNVSLCQDGVWIKHSISYCNFYVKGYNHLIDPLLSPNSIDYCCHTCRISK